MGIEPSGVVAVPGLRFKDRDGFLNQNVLAHPNGEYRILVFLAGHPEIIAEHWGLSGRAA